MISKLTHDSDSISPRRIHTAALQLQFLCITVPVLMPFLKLPHPIIHTRHFYPCCAEQLLFVYVNIHNTCCIEVPSEMHLITSVAIMKINTVNNKAIQCNEHRIIIIKCIISLNVSIVFFSLIYEYTSEEIYVVFFHEHYKPHSYVIQCGSCY